MTRGVGGGAAPRSELMSTRSSPEPCRDARCTPTTASLTANPVGAQHKIGSTEQSDQQGHQLVLAFSVAYQRPNKFFNCWPGLLAPWPDGCCPPLRPSITPL